MTVDDVVKMINGMIEKLKTRMKEHEEDIGWVGYKAQEMILSRLLEKIEIERHSPKD